MPAPPIASRRVIPATRSVQFNNALFDNRVERMGAETEDDKARLCNVDRSTLYRYRTGKTVPLLDEGMRFAACVDLTVADLWTGNH